MHPPPSKCKSCSQSLQCWVKTTHLQLGMVLILAGWCWKRWEKILAGLAGGGQQEGTGEWRKERKYCCPQTGSRLGCAGKELLKNSSSLDMSLQTWTFTPILLACL